MKAAALIDLAIELVRDDPEDTDSKLIRRWMVRVQDDKLQRVAEPFGVTVMSGGGFDSTTDKYNFAADLARHGQQTLVHSLGDHDPSGAHMFLVFLKEVEAFCRDLGGAATFTTAADRQSQSPDSPSESDRFRARAIRQCVPS